MLKKQPKPTEFGVCVMLQYYAIKVVPMGKLGKETRMFLQEIGYNVRCAWNGSTAVPSTQTALYPVAHPTMDEEKAFMEHSDNQTMWDLSTEYGQNRQQYLEFMSDYLEEAWK